MNKRLENKNVIITAAGQGIGKATAIAFHNEGANVIATDINEETLEILNKKYPNIKVKKLDSTDKEELGNTVALIRTKLEMDNEAILNNMEEDLEKLAIKYEESLPKFSSIINKLTQSLTGLGI